MRQAEPESTGLGREELSDGHVEMGVGDRLNGFWGERKPSCR